MATRSNSALPQRPDGSHQHRRPLLTVDRKDLYRRAIRAAIFKLDPRIAVRSPVQFVLGFGAIVACLATLDPSLLGTVQADPRQERMLNGAITVILWFTLLATNFAEAVAEAWEKAHAAALSSTCSTAIARKIAPDGTVQTVSSVSLRKGDRVNVMAGDQIPADGQVLQGLGFVDEAVMTGKSTPILKQPGAESFSSVTEGSRLLSDQLVVQITADPEPRLSDRRIARVGDAKRLPTVHSIAFTVLCAGLTLGLLIGVATRWPIAIGAGEIVGNSLRSSTNLPLLIGLLIALIPTPIEGLLNVLRIAGLDRVAHLNVITTSSQAIAACGNLQTLIFDKTGTLTLGYRQAAQLIPIEGHSIEELAQAAFAASMFDQTPEGRSILRLAKQYRARLSLVQDNAIEVAFSAKTRLSGIDLPDGQAVRKGAVEAIQDFVRARGGISSPELELACARVSRLGGTPLGVCQNDQLYGVIDLKDTVKPGLQARFAQLRRLGISTIMLTGDNPITAAIVAQAAGVDTFMAETTPEGKLAVIRAEQSRGKLVAMTGDGTNDAIAIAQANVGLALHSGTQAAKAAANLIDLDSDPTKMIDLVGIGQQLFRIKGALTTFSIANNLAKYFVIVPPLFAAAGIGGNILGFKSVRSTIIAVLIYNALTLPAFIPLALRSIRGRFSMTDHQLQRHLLFGGAGIIAPLIAIKLIDMLLPIV